MNIFVCVKQVPDTETKVVPSSDGQYIETGSIKWVMNPYDEYAVEEALQLKAKFAGSTVTVVRVGNVEKSTEVLRTAMAMGADDSILVEAPIKIDSHLTAKALHQAILKSDKKPDVIFAGKQAIDTDALQVSQILAQLFEIPSVTVIGNFEVKDESNFTVKREIEGGTVEIYDVTTPVVLTCNKGLNNPRYASLPGIMKAKKKPLAKYTLEDLGLKLDDQRITFDNFRLPPEKPEGKKFDASDEAVQRNVVKDVINLLKTEAKVI